MPRWPQEMSAKDAATGKHLVHFCVSYIFRALSHRPLCVREFLRLHWSEVAEHILRSDTRRPSDALSLQAPSRDVFASQPLDFWDFSILAQVSRNPTVRL